MDRESFNHIVKDAAARRRELYELFLKEVQIFEGMDPYERNKLSDALKTIEFPAEATIITEGEVGDTFYIIGKMHLLISVDYIVEVFIYLKISLQSRVKQLQLRVDK